MSDRTSHTEPHPNFNFRCESTVDGCKKVDLVLGEVQKQLSPYQVLEIVRALHFYMRHMNEEVNGFPHIKEFNDMDEEILMEKVRTFR